MFKDVMSQIIEDRHELAIEEEYEMAFKYDTAIWVLSHYVCEKCKGEGELKYYGDHGSVESEPCPNCRGTGLISPLK